MALRILFFGTPAFAVPSLDGLLASRHTVVGVVTQPDRPRGRGQKVLPAAVKVRALASALPILQPTRLRDDVLMAELAALRPDLGVVAAYGRLLPQRLLDLPPMGMVNVHASLLPRWRGAAPIHRAVTAGDRETGVTIMRVVLALDAGPMLARVQVPIGSEETSAALEPRLAEAGAALLLDTLDLLERGVASEEVQDETMVTYANRLEKSESQVDWNRPAAVVHNQIRGLQPWPLAAAMLDSRRVALLQAQVTDAPLAPSLPALPGVVIAVQPEAFTVATAPGAIRVTRIQPEGRAPMSVRDFMNGHLVRVGSVLAPLSGTS